MPDTYVSTVSGEEILVQIGDGASPELFAHDCMINGSRSFNMSASTKDQTIPNCTDPSKPDKTVRTVEAEDSTISGEGKVHKTSLKTWLDRVGTTFNVRVLVAGAFQAAGLYILTEFSLTGTAREYATASVTLVQADKPTITAGT